MTLKKLKMASHEDLKLWITQALLRLPSNSCHQHTLVSKICSLKGVSTLRGQPRVEFEKKINKAVAALLMKKAVPFLIRPNPKSNFIKLVRRNPRY
jgi:hypothetical protein